MNSSMAIAENEFMRFDNVTSVLQIPMNESVVSILEGNETLSLTLIDDSVPN